MPHPEHTDEEARFGTLPAALRTVIDATGDVPTLQRWTALLGTATADEIAAALRPGKPARTRSGARPSRRSR